MGEFRLLRPEEVLDRWADLSSVLAQAVGMGRGELTVDDVRQLVLAGRMFVLADEKFAVTCEFVVYPKKTVMIAGFGAGRVPNHAEVAETLEGFARKGGASAIQTYCANPAMVRYYARYFDNVLPVYTVLEKTL